WWPAAPQWGLRAVPPAVAPLRSASSTPEEAHCSCLPSRPDQTLRTCAVYTAADNQCAARTIAQISTAPAKHCCRNLPAHQRGNYGGQDHSPTHLPAHVPAAPLSPRSTCTACAWTLPPWPRLVPSSRSHSRGT